MNFTEEFRDRRVLNELRELSLIFDRCEVKSLLLPSFKHNKLDCCDDFMTSEDTIHQLYHWHPDNSCLILQPQERFFRNSITIFDAFPHFDVALKQTDLWPAVMFWDKYDNFAFVPVRNKKELINLYEILYYEGNSITQIRRYADRKKEANYYYFHLSDLHLGRYALAC